MQICELCEYLELILWLTVSVVDVKEAYIADSESSSIRALNLQTGGSRLLVGGDPVFSDNLFKVYLQYTICISC